MTLDDYSDDDDDLDQSMRSLWDEGAAIWDRLENSAGFEAYVPADYQQVLDSLKSLRGQACTFLEWGSGLGIVTIMASRLGFDAYGLEIAPALVEHARELASRYARNARFEIGSFVPAAYQWNPEFGDDGTRTDFESACGYQALGMELCDFDLIYAYPWPDEHPIFRDIVRQFGNKMALFLTYDAREGMGSHTFGKQTKRRKNGDGRP